MKWLVLIVLPLVALSVLIPRRDPEARPTRPEESEAWEEPRVAPPEWDGSRILIGGGWGDRIRPCGCSSDMQGGVARVVSVWRETPNTLGLFAGPVVSKDRRLVPLEERAVREIFREAGLAAYGVSPRDTETRGSVLDLGDGVVRIGSGEPAVVPVKTWRIGETQTLGWIHLDRPSPASVDVEWDERCRAHVRSVVSRTGVSLVSCTYELWSDPDWKEFLESSGVDLIALIGGTRRSGAGWSKHGPRLFYSGQGGLAVYSIRLTGTRDAIDWNRSKVVRLSPEVAPDPYAWCIIEGMLRERSLLGLKSMAWADPERFGHGRCAECHPAAVENWKRSAHASAWETLPIVRRGEAQCLACHITPVGEFRGAKSLRGVECSTCHLLSFPGPGAGHGKVHTRRDCERCHTEEKAPHFDRSEATERLMPSGSCGG